MSARQQALATEELLENILLLLPISDILIRAPLVSKTWRATVEGLPRLQQALFFMPVKGKPLRLFDTGWAEDEKNIHAYTVSANPWFHSIYDWA
ncbi:hypothetical protein B0A55_05406 [Friedmanniomyces simplex]|uniref:F-box domain-containing protein n=1 Tax=Friedmanniomyces simplex TaxID=329884 RepID=A0A4U0X7F1_9PEZI|nr:hypothetical protein B0A55_05406 [Friedmanniomyces simplex]